MSICKEAGCSRECLLCDDYCTVHQGMHSNNLFEKGACAYLAVLCDSRTMNEGMEITENLAETIRKKTNSDYLAGTTVAVGAAVSGAASGVVQGVKYINKIGWGNAIKIAKALKNL